MKKEDNQEMEISFVKTMDIAKEVGKSRKEGQILVGFAAETESLVKNAKKKLEEKNLDLIVANDVTKEGAGPEVDTNIATLVYKDGKIEKLPLMRKEELAAEILTRLAKM
jgi:phosphopantothenoylcysteine decarboxylase/phosphopantothenate--cysteine ligase